MHHALEIQEILSNIFRHCNSEWHPSADLAILARTCRAFKDPALDLLWEELPDLTPLAGCLLGAIKLSSTDPGVYSFHRALTWAEWDVLRSYTRRIRSLDSLLGFSRRSITYFWKPPVTDPLFPKLRNLSLDYKHRTITLLLMPFPSLTSLCVKMPNTPHSFEDSIKSFARASPSLRELRIFAEHPAGINMNYVDPRFLCQWLNLQTVICPSISLDVNTCVHLSRMPTLTWLNFKLGGILPHQIPLSDSPLVFSNLQHLMLNSELLDPISRLLSRVHLPVVAHFVASIKHCPSAQDLLSFLTCVQTSGIGHTAREVALDQVYVSDRRYASEDRPTLGFLDLQPYRTFTNLRHINFNIACKMNMTDNELLTLAMAWPRLEILVINRGWGWHTLGGITPNGLLRLLQTCPSLCWIALAVDTRGYTTIPPSPPRFEEPAPHLFSLHVLDSYIEVESVPAIAAFLTNLAPSFCLDLCAWEREEMAWSPHLAECKVLWEDVHRRVKKVRRCC